MRRMIWMVVFWMAAVGVVSAQPATTQPKVHPAGQRRANPFAPSAALQRRMSIQTNVQSSPSPILVGVIVKANAQVTACFQIGKRCVILSPGESVSVGRCQYQFESYAHGCARMRDDQGRTYLLRIALQGDVQKQTGEPMPVQS